MFQWSCCISAWEKTKEHLNCKIMLKKHVVFGQTLGLFTDFPRQHAVQCLYTSLHLLLWEKNTWLFNFGGRCKVNQACEFIDCTWFVLYIKRTSVLHILAIGWHTYTHWNRQRLVEKLTMNVLSNLSCDIGLPNNEKTRFWYLKTHYILTLNIFGDLCEFMCISLDLWPEWCGWFRWSKGGNSPRRRTSKTFSESD